MPAPDPADRSHRWVYPFAEAPAGNVGLLGGKGAGLAAMTAAGLPVPPGLTVTTEACVVYQRHGSVFPEGLWTQTRDALRGVEEAAGRRFQALCGTDERRDPSGRCSADLLSPFVWASTRRPSRTLQARRRGR